MRRSLIRLAAFWLAVAVARGAQIVGDRLWLEVESEPVSDVLLRFARLGVRVRCDPGARARLTGRFEGVPVENALQRLLEPLDYAVIWEMVEGPGGPWPRLAEIQVFRRGMRALAEPLIPQTYNYEVTRAALPGEPLVIKDELLVAFRPGAQRRDIERFLLEIGASLIAGDAELGVYRIKLPPDRNLVSALEQIQRHPVVRHVEPHYAVALEARAELPQGVYGSSFAASGTVKVAVLDSGLRKDLLPTELIAGQYDSVQPGRSVDDALGHGTQMALLATGLVRPLGWSSVSGPTLPLVAVRAFDDNGVASFFGIMDALRYAVRQGARVVNLSWGTPTYSRFLEEALRWAQKEGVTVVAAAGNEPVGRPYFPAALPNVVAVSALDPEGGVWESSNFGDFVFVAAPGFAEFGVGHQGPPGLYAGTSIASAWVSRALALYFDKHPDATPAQAIEALKRAVGGERRDARVGFGVFDEAALRRLLE